MSFTSVISSVGREVFDLAYRCSPIILTGGIASETLGTAMPILLLTESLGFANNIITGEVSLSTDDFFAHFFPLPGSSLIANSVGQYPFANQTVAANALISEPLNLSMQMICPPRKEGAYVTKMATISALQAALDKHNNMGGMYTVLTPGYIYTSMIMTGFRDVTPNPETLPQSQFQLDFVRPLTQLTEASQKQSTLMSKLTSGSKTGTSWGATGSGNVFGNLVSSVL